MKMPYALLRICRRVRSEGLWRTLRFAGSLLLEPYHEWRTGIRTFGPGFRSFGFGERETFSITTDYGSFRRIVRQVNLQEHEDVFLDYGCGRGRVVVLAARYPFKQVIGVEYSGKLVAEARQNLDRVRERLICKDVHVLQADAGAFETPDESTVIYFFNPFGDEVFSRVVQQIERSFRRRPRKITIIYYRPECEHLLQACDWLIKKKELDLVRARCCIYESVLS